MFMPMGFSEAELAIVDRGIEGLGLKHFELVDGVGGDVVCADEPWLLCVPGVGLGFGPAPRRLRGCSDDECQGESEDCE